MYTQMTLQYSMYADYCRVLKKCNEVQVPLLDHDITQLPLQLLSQNSN